MAVPLCQQAEREFPRTGRGRKPEIADWILAVLIMVAVIKRKKSKSAQYRFIDEHRRELNELWGTDTFPARSNYLDRYRRAHRLIAQAIMLQGGRAIAEGIVDAAVVASDKSLTRRQFYRSRRGKAIYRRRSQTVEPFNEWFKTLFELQDRVWHRGLENNRTQLLAAFFVYGLLVRYNHRLGNENARIRWIIDTQ
jgi:hypothetical protein